jgi:hypothetical protein
MKGMIYILTSNGKVYIGQTIKPKTRFSNHKSDYENYKKGTQHYKSSYKIIELGDYKFEIIEEIEFEDKDDLKKREQFFMDLYKEKGLEVVNKCCAYTGKNKKEYNRDYYQKNIDKKKQQNKKRYEKNKEIIKQKNREKYEKTKEYVTCEDCNKILLKTNLKRHNKTCCMKNIIIKSFEEDVVKDCELEMVQTEECKASS